MKSRILQILRNASEYVSGQELCETLGVSRTAVWKVINKLKEEGYEIEAVQNRGYRILAYPDVITDSEIESRLDTGWAGSRVLYFEETDSTNNQAKRSAEEGAPHGTLVVAERQSAGKGRRGKSWSSPQGSGIFMSLLLKPELSPEYASMLTLVTALSVSKAVEEVTGLKAMIKWPNDLVLNRKKITGILTEMSAELEQIHYVVIGIGINVNMEELPKEIRETATSLWLESGKRTSRAELIAAFLRCFEKDYEQFIRTEDVSLLMEEYNARLINRNKEVRIMDPAGEYGGIALGIDEKGHLLVERENRGLEKITSGEVSVRGVYGYV